MRIGMFVVALLFCVFALAQTGCVNEENAAKYDLAVKEGKAAAARVVAIKDQLVALRADYESGKLAAKDLSVQLELLTAEMKVAVADGQKAGEAVKAYATSDEQWYDKLGYVLMSLIGVALGRKLGIPGLVTGTQPLAAIGKKPEE